MEFFLVILLSIALHTMVMTFFYFRKIKKIADVVIVQAGALIIHEAVNKQMGKSEDAEYTLKFFNELMQDLSNGKVASGLFSFDPWWKLMGCTREPSLEEIVTKIRKKYKLSD